MRKSNDVLGHIYAEILKIVKGSKTFKQHCICFFFNTVMDAILGFFDE